MSRRVIRAVAVVIGAAALTSFMLLITSLPTHSSAVAQPIERAGTPLSMASASSFTLGVELVATGLNYPTYLADARDGSGRLFVLEQAGRIRVISNGILLNAPYLDISNTVSFGGPDSELGLLGLAFDPDFASNGTFYLDYTNVNSDTNIERLVVANPAADVASVITATRIITIAQPDVQHKAGALQFGPNDDYLYVGLGDGGGAGDPRYIGQNLTTTLLAKILRINVRGVPTYTIPPTNPFSQTADVLPETWAYGLRNPWRFSFDRANGDMYIGDVGQHCYEEIDFQPAASHGGENYGWSITEGNHGFDHVNFDLCAEPIVTPTGITRPILEYSHNGLLAAIVGGYVYRGSRYPQMSGVYFYADHEQGLISSLEQIGPGNWINSLRLDIWPEDISSFGEDAAGELYLVTYTTGRIYQIVAGPPPPDLASSTKQASAITALRGDLLTYTIALRNTGGTFSDMMRVTDTVPAGLNYLANSLTATLGGVDESSAPLLKWSGIMADTPLVTITYAVTASAASAITNTVSIDPGFAGVFTRSATVVVYGARVYLPLIFRNP